MQCSIATSTAEWESFLTSQPWSPFLQSWTMGEVYGAVGQEPVRIEIRNPKSEIRNDDEIVGICQAIVVPAKRGKHLSVSYGPVLAASSNWQLAISSLVGELKKVAREKGCAFIRMSPFWCFDSAQHDRQLQLQRWGFRPSPLHMLAEHIWYLDLKGKSEEDILKGMRPTTRNLVRRAEREGVTVAVSDNPSRDLLLFLKLHEETRKRHRFVPYPNDFIRAQVERFSDSAAPRTPSPTSVEGELDGAGSSGSGSGRCALYLARYAGAPVAASIHMIHGGETSYHHGASSAKHSKIPASYLLQWRAIQDALKRGDRIYNFWGIAPVQGTGNSKCEIRNSKHPFAGVTLFKTGFGGELLELQHCMDLPISKKYWITFGIETLRKWKRGF